MTKTEAVVHIMLPDANKADLSSTSGRGFTNKSLKTLNRAFERFR